MRNMDDQVKIIIICGGWVLLILILLLLTGCLPVEYVYLNKTVYVDKPVEVPCQACEVPIVPKCNPTIKYVNVTQPCDAGSVKLVNKIMRLENFIDKYINVTNCSFAYEQLNQSCARLNATYRNWTESYRNLTIRFNNCTEYLSDCRHDLDICEG